MELPEMTRRDLYGGAMSAMVPKDLIDMSIYRSVPPNQEFFADADGTTSLIFELLEMVDDNDDLSAIRTHFEEVADINETSQFAQIQSVITIPLLNTSPVQKATLLLGSMYGKKGGGTAQMPTNVRVNMALLRLHNVSTDMLITVNYDGLDQSGCGQVFFTEKIFPAIVGSTNIHKYSLFTQETKH